MSRKQISLIPQPISSGALDRLEALAVIARFRPTQEALHPPEGENVGATLYESDERFGPHRLITVGVNRCDVRLGMHGDNEDFLIPPHGLEVKPLYLVLCHLKLDELRRRDALGELTADDFTCLSIYPCPRGAEMFTMRAGAIHCEATRPGAGPIGCFYVTESRDLDTIWVDLQLSPVSIDAKLDPGAPC